MQSFQFKSQIGQDGVLNLQLPVTLANRKVEIVLVINTETDKQFSERPIGLYSGKMKMSKDFSEPLPDEFWLPANLLKKRITKNAQYQR